MIVVFISIKKQCYGVALLLFIYIWAWNLKGNPKKKYIPMLAFLATTRRTLIFISAQNMI